MLKYLRICFKIIQRGREGGGVDVYKLLKQINGYMRIHYTLLCFFVDV